MQPAFPAALAEHRPALLRHCYRMLGSFSDAEDLVQDTLERAWAARESHSGKAPLKNWLYAIATNACLNALAKKRPLALPQLERGPANEDYILQELERSHWITPAPDAAMFPDPAERAESRETVALAFVALLQRLPPRQRAVLLMKDVLGWPAEEIADALGLSLASVNSALHRARKGVATARAASEEPPPEVLREYVRAWEERDLHRLVAVLRNDVVFAMPPHSVWFRGSDAVERFLQTPRFQAFWSSGLRVLLTRANGVPALAFYRPDDGGAYVRHSIGVTRFLGGQVAESTVFIGAAYFAGFAVPEKLDRTVLPGPSVMEGKGGPP